MSRKAYSRPELAAYLWGCVIPFVLAKARTVFFTELLYREIPA